MMESREIEFESLAHFSIVVFVVLLLLWQT